MSAKRFAAIALTLAAFMLGGIVQPYNYLPSFAQGDCQSFTQTGKWVCEPFLSYWRNNGGVAQQGYPISDAFQEVSDLDGKSYTVQYFERAEFEYHPENQPPYNVLLSQLGTLQYRRKYPNGDPTNAEAQVSLPTTTVKMYFDNLMSGSEYGAIQLGGRYFLSKRLQGRLGRGDPLGRIDPYDWLIGRNFPSWRTMQDAPRTDFSGNGPAWVLLLDDKGNTVGVFTLVKEDGDWKIDYVEPNVLTN